jgi:hypothetical protein
MECVWGIFDEVYVKKKNKGDSWGGKAIRTRTLKARYEDVWGSVCIAPHIHNLDTKLAVT